jgi:glycosyltransferase involved in cell wall biosynthesis
LILVDDGSERECSRFAEEQARVDPDRILLLEHEGHENLGINASRNLGLERARGDLVAFLDSDDVWMPFKLAEQVAIMEKHPEAGMLYGSTRYWYSWTGRERDLDRDFEPILGVSDTEVLSGTRFLEGMLTGTLAVPCMCSVIARTEQARKAGGFDDEFSLFEDQRFYARMGVHSSVLVRSRCWDLYRQHADSICAVSRNAGMMREARRMHAEWLEGFLAKVGLQDGPVWMALRRRKWLEGRGGFWSRTGPRRFRKVLLRLEEWLLPSYLRRRIWSQ